MKTPDANDDRTLEQDLLEDSEKRFHHDVTKVQIKQYDRLQEVIGSVEVWRAEEEKKGSAYNYSNPDHMEFICESHIQKMREKFAEEAAELIDSLRRERATREIAIHLFCVDHS